MLSIDCTLVMQDPVFSSNSAGRHGGALSMTGVKAAILMPSSFLGNSAGVNGGCVWLNQSVQFMAGTEFSSCQAVLGGTCFQCVPLS